MVKESPFKNSQRLNLLIILEFLWVFATFTAVLLVIFKRLYAFFKALSENTERGKAWVDYMLKIYAVLSVIKVKNRFFSQTLVLYYYKVLFSNA